MKFGLKHIILIIPLIILGLILSYFINRGFVNRLGFSNTAPANSVMQRDSFYFSTPEKSSLSIEKTSNLSLKVASVSTAITQITQIAKDGGGYLTSASTNRLDNGLVYGEISIAVPQDKLEMSIVEIRKIATKVIQENITNRNRIQEKTDLEARLKNASFSESQLQKLMEKSGSVNDVLQVQRELANVRETIESLKGQLDLLNKSVTYSTITASLSTQEDLLPISEDQWFPLATAKSALRLLVKVAKFSLNLGIWLSVFAIPLVIIILIPITVIKKIRLKK